MKTIRIQFEYRCYPVWIYDDEGLVEDTALPPELANDRGLDEQFKSLQARFDLTYVNTATEFYNKGFASQEDEIAFRSDLKTAIANLKEKCPEGYTIEVVPDFI